MVFLFLKHKYVEAVLKRFNMQNSKAAVTPTVMGLKLSKEDSSKDFDPKLYKSIVGSLMYLTATRPDIMHAVSLISRFMEKTERDTLAGSKENSKVCEWNKTVWYFILLF